MNSNSCVSAPRLRAVNGPAWLALSMLLLSGFVTTLDLFVVSVATPNMQVGLGASFAQIGSIVIRVNVSGGGSRRAFGSALTGDDAAARTCEYASVARMVYNLGAALLVCVLLLLLMLMLAKAERSAG